MADVTPPKPEGRKLATGPTLSDQAYRALREDITSGTLKAGEKLTERALAQSLGVSATPVREALQRLEQERLIVRGDARTITVSNPGDEQLYALTLIEGALRGVAARLAAERATDGEILRLRETCQSAEQRLAETAAGSAHSSQVLQVTRRFHELVDSAAHDKTLVDMIATATAFDWAFRVKWSTTVHRHEAGAAEPLRQHRQIAEAIARRDGEAAEAIMRAHIAGATAAFMAVHDNRTS